MTRSLVRFFAASILLFALAFTMPWVLLVGPAWTGYALLRAVGPAPAHGPTIEGRAMVFPDEPTPLRLEDPYLVAGVPLYFALWFARQGRPGQRRWPRAFAGFVMLELFAGVVVALVGYCVLNGLTASPRREAIEWAALSGVALIRVLPVLLWLALDPAQPFRLQGVSAGATRSSRATKAGSSRRTSNSGSERR